ncbi:MAG: coniferyl aldehyde dehydrogenase [Pseudomonadota bacterium]
MPKDTAADGADFVRDRFEAMQAAHRTDREPSWTERRRRLTQLREMLIAHEDALIAAIEQDFGHRAEMETRVAELDQSHLAIGHALSHVKRWMKPRRASTGLLYLPGRNKVVPQPLGVVGIIAPWNYPLLLTIGPLVGALAAGNRAILKPSEFTPAFSEALVNAVADHFDATEVTVVTGGADVAQALTHLPLGHLLFTGSTKVGRMVAEAAAKNLTPVTLELGGKSPAIIDPSANLDQTILRMVRGKLFNAGQTCIAPDYVLAPRDKVDEIADRIIAQAKDMAPADQGPSGTTAIINDSHHSRLQRLIDEAERAGATVRRAHEVGEDMVAKRLMPLTVLTNIPEDTAVMQDEIFGPILPIVAYDTLDDALEYIAARPHPLSLYWFGSHAGRQDRVTREAMAGGITINDALLHIAQESLPFGGVGDSGIGAYHGRYGFDAMSHLKAVFIQTRLPAGSDWLRQPVGPITKRLMQVSAWWSRR